MKILKYENSQTWHKIALEKNIKAKLEKTCFCHKLAEISTQRERASETRKNFFLPQASRDINPERKRERERHFWTKLKSSTGH